MPARQRMTCGRLDEEYAMQRFISIVFGAGLLAITSFANAAGQLASVNVQSSTQSIVIQCTPPSDSQQCADFHAAIRKSFSTREIGMLFGSASAYQEYLTSNDRLRAKYAAFVREAEESGVAVAVAAR
jgi:hypothetical protein